MERNSIQIKNIVDSASNSTLRLRFSKPSGSFSVKVNGNPTDDYVIENGYVVVSVPFANCTVTVA